MSDLLNSYMRSMPLIAILRGVTPKEVVAVVDSLVSAGIRIVEVPLNSPDALESIELLTNRFGDELLIGAGTVTRPEEVKKVALAGGRIIVSPNVNTAVIKVTKELGMVSAPGVATPTEAFAAIYAGADTVKAFPAEMIGPSVIKSWQAVLPKEVPIVPVGGIGNTNMKEYWLAGARGFGLGGSLYKVGKSLEDIRTSALSAVKAIESLPAMID